MSQKFKHTPGPWEAVIDPQRSTWFLIAFADWHTRVCRMTLYAYEEEEQEANARLIAASPDLLEALEAMVEHFATPTSERSAASYGKTKAQVADEARAAIAKAIGEA
jgi:hypothetical protein